MFRLHRDSPSWRIRQNLRRRHRGQVREDRASGTPWSSVTGRLGSRSPMPRPWCNSSFVWSCFEGAGRGRTYPCARCSTALHGRPGTGFRPGKVANPLGIRSERCLRYYDRSRLCSSRLSRGTRWRRGKCCRRWKGGSLWDIGRGDLQLHSDIFL